MPSPFERYLNYPLEVTIETTGRCNARCVFCPHSQIERKHTDMPDELFALILEQLTMIPREHRFYISPFKVNEMLMDRQIFERIGMINRALPGAMIRVFTNMGAATGKDLEQLCEIENLNDIDISLNSLDAEEYHALMGLDLERTLGNVMRFLSLARSRGLSMHSRAITISRVAQDAQSDAAFIDAFHKTFERFADMAAPLVIARGEWIDFIPSATPLRQAQPCMRWLDVNLCCTGIAAFCCMDAHAAYPLGDVRESSVLDIYNQPRWRDLRIQQPHKSEIMPCKYCSQ